jgi:hypothetical protein
MCVKCDAPPMWRLHSSGSGTGRQLMHVGMQDALRALRKHEGCTKDAQAPSPQRKDGS